MKDHIFNTFGIMMSQNRDKKKNRLDITTDYKVSLKKDVLTKTRSVMTDPPGKISD